MAVYYKLWGHHLTNYDVIISQVVTSLSHRLWRHYLTSYDVIISEVMTSLSRKLWRHYLRSYGVIISQVMTSLSRKLWRHHPTRHDVISQVMTSSHKLWRHYVTSYDVICSLYLYIKHTVTEAQILPCISGWVQQLLYDLLKVAWTFHNYRKDETRSPREGLRRVSTQTVEIYWAYQQNNSGVWSCIFWWRLNEKL